MDIRVHWAELQSELSGAGLNVVVNIPTPDGLWFGKIDGKPFTMTISSKSKEDGPRDFMIVSLCGQKDEMVIPALSRFMGYKPFCKYMHKGNPYSTISYEWDTKDTTAKLKNLEKNADVYELQKMEEGFLTGVELIQ